MSSSTKASAHTLEQVRKLLDMVAAHPRLGKAVVERILVNSGGAPVPTSGPPRIEDVKPKKYGRIVRKCEEVLKEQPSEKDEELIVKIDAAVKAEEKATSVVTERGVELGKLLIEAFHRYPTEKPFRAFLKWTAFTTLKRAADLIAAAGGMKESEELRRQLARGADNTAKSRGRNKPPAITKPAVIADPPRITGNGGVRLGNGQPLDTSKLSPTAQQAIARATGNDVDAEASAQAMKEAHGAEPVETFEGPPTQTAEDDDKPLAVSVMLDNRLATIEGLTPWALWLECSEHLAALMNVPTREGMTKETASLVRRLTNNHHTKKAA